MKRLIIATLLTSAAFLTTACDGETTGADVQHTPVSYEGGSLKGENIPQYEPTSEKSDNSSQQLHSPHLPKQSEDNHKEFSNDEQQLNVPQLPSQSNSNNNSNTTNQQQTPAAKKPVHTTGQSKKIPAKFVRVVDGDTARFMYDGQVVAVRYLLIDTPESKSPRVGWQPFGREASDYNERLLKQAKQTYLEFDVGDKKDRYGRLLAYVWADDILVNEKLVREGYAIKAYVYPPNTRYLSRIEQAQRLAKQERKNVWSLDGFVSNGDFVGGSKIDGNKNFPQFKQ